MAKEAINDGRCTLHFSDVSAMEITLKWSAEKLQLPEPPRLWIEHQLQQWSIITARITRQDMYRAAELPTYHKDPFDRLLIASALNQNATLLTPDAAIKSYPVSTRW
ncbi:MAG: type II toxin-antitoxin system VapC family toxin [Verrucomicrobia bacterium]|nr:type II toxin-antitoxin system VapC family toxin [Verrucomicrobiota bacterium]